MMARFVAAQRPGYLRKAVLIAVAAIAVMIALATVAFSQTKIVNGYILVDGVLKPDGSVGISWKGNKYIYDHHQFAAARAMMPDTSPKQTTVTRNGRDWFTLTTAKDGTITISDPNGNPQQPIVTIPSHSAGPAKPETR